MHERAGLPERLVAATSVLMIEKHYSVLITI
jgi:hypothetical protein